MHLYPHEIILTEKDRTRETSREREIHVERDTDTLGRWGLGNRERPSQRHRQTELRKRWKRKQSIICVQSPRRNSLFVE